MDFVNKRKRIGIVSLFVGIGLLIGQGYAGIPLPSPPLPRPPENLMIAYEIFLEGDPDYTHIIGLDWDDNPEPYVIGYNVYQRRYPIDPEMPVDTTKTFTEWSKMDDIYVSLYEYYKYDWWVTAIDSFDQESDPSDIVSFPSQASGPQTVAASEVIGSKITCTVSPNPVRSMAHIRYQIANNSFVSLAVYDVNGRLVERLINKRMGSGNYSAEWTTENLENGVYFINLRAGGSAKTIKVVLAR